MRSQRLISNHKTLCCSRAAKTAISFVHQIVNYLTMFVLSFAYFSCLLLHNKRTNNLLIYLSIVVCSLLLFIYYYLLLSYCVVLCCVVLLLFVFLSFFFFFSCLWLVLRQALRHRVLTQERKHLLLLL